MIEVEFWPCYPKDYTTEKQNLKIDEEKREIEAADNWEEEIRDLLDLCQTIISQMEIVKEGNDCLTNVLEDYRNIYWVRKIHSDSYIGQMDFNARLNGFKAFCKEKQAKDAFHLGGCVIDLGLGSIYDLLVENYSTNTLEMQQKIIDFMKEHNEKIQKVQKQIEAGTYPNREVI